MGIVSAIYKAPVIATAISEIAGEITLLIKYDGKLFTGSSFLHPDDKEFFSERVGTCIAKSRARLSAFEYAIKEAQKTAEIKERMMLELIHTTGYSWEELDPTGKVRQNIDKSMALIEGLKKAYSREKKFLANYLEGQDRAVDSVKLHRRLEAEKAENNQ